MYRWDKWTLEVKDTFTGWSFFKHFMKKAVPKQAQSNEVYGTSEDSFDSD